MINSIIPDSALGGDADMAGGGGAADAEPPRTHRGGWPDLDKPSSMTARFDSVIASLYDALPLQDQDSGVRFPVGCDKELADHKDWLFRKREVRHSPPLLARATSPALHSMWFIYSMQCSFTACNLVVGVPTPSQLFFLRCNPRFSEKQAGRVATRSGVV
jgi:hypothetical protein